MTLLKVFLDYLITYSSGADILVTPRRPNQFGVLRETPRLLVEIMSPSNVTVAGLDDMAQKIKFALAAETKVVWVVWHEKNQVGHTGVQVHVGEYNPNAPFFHGSEMLPDDGLDLHISAEQALSFI